MPNIAGELNNVQDVVSGINLTETALQVNNNNNNMYMFSVVVVITLT